MAKLTKIYTLELTQIEMAALEQLLGGLTDPQFEKAGIKGGDRRALSDIWNLLPSPRDADE